MGQILDGKALANSVLRDLANSVKQLAAMYGRPPGLAVVIVGESPASLAYVANKERAAKKCGFNTFNAHLPESITFRELGAAIEAFNKQPEIDGILVQLPLPKHLDADRVIDLIRPDKDADSLHPVNQGLLMRGKGSVRPCTPLGCMMLIDQALLDAEAFARGEKADLSGKSAVVIGRSILVGKPVALMLQERNATVTMAHSRTKDLPAVVREADIVIAAVGVPHLVKAEWIKPTALVIDVGINRIESGPLAGKLTGDVDFEAIKDRCAAITPVPGGVGPMTVAMLMYNTWLGYKRSLGES